MKKEEAYRPRLSIVLPLELKQELDELLGGWKIKNALYERITSDLVRVMKQMSPTQRRTFIVAVIEGHLDPKVYLKTIGKTLEGK